jgi:hypothetical protein
MKIRKVYYSFLVLTLATSFLPTHSKTFDKNVCIKKNLNVCGNITSHGDTLFNGLRSYGQFFNYAQILNAPQPLGVPVPWLLSDGSSGASSTNSSNFSLNTSTGVITIANPGTYMVIFAARFKYPQAASVGNAQGEALLVLNGSPLNYRITTGEVNINTAVPVTLYSEPTNTAIIQTPVANSQLTLNITLENSGVLFTSPAHTYHSNAFLTIVQLN